MKKLLFLAFILIGIGLGLIFTVNVLPSFRAHIPPAAVALLTFKATPQTVTIPSIGVQASVESVGKETDGKMADPEDTNNVGWYALGPSVGQRGSAVMAGHFDSLTGPAVFYRLGELSVGDTITVRDTGGTEYQYEVTTIETYSDEEFPIQKIFGDAGEARLNLITCDGVFDKTSKTYSHRTVVYSKLLR